jgi:hypothetical protein
MAVAVPILLGAVPLVALLLAKARRRRGRGNKGDDVSDPKKNTSAAIGDLLPAVQGPVQAVLQAMQAKGHDPRVFETYRSPSRAEYLKTIGRSKAGAASYHCKRRAVDMVDNRRDSNGDRVLWGAPSGKGNDAERAALADGFFRDYGAEVKRQGGTWGGDWSFYDPAHAQW